MRSKLPDVTRRCPRDYAGSVSIDNPQRFDQREPVSSRKREVCNEQGGRSCPIEEGDGVLSSRRDADVNIECLDTVEAGIYALHIRIDHQDVRAMRETW